MQSFPEAGKGAGAGSWQSLSAYLWTVRQQEWGALLGTQGSDLLWTEHSLPVFFTVPRGAGAASLCGDTWGAEGNAVPEPPDAPLCVPRTQLGLLANLEIQWDGGPAHSWALLSPAGRPAPPLLCPPTPTPWGVAAPPDVIPGRRDEPHFGLRFQGSFSNPAFPGTEFQPLALVSPKVWGKCPWQPQALCRRLHPSPLPSVPCVVGWGQI